MEPQTEAQTERIVNRPNVWAGETRIDDWQTFPEGVFVDVTMPSMFPGETPVYTASITGVVDHWNTKGGSAVCNPSRNGFRIYVQWADPTRDPVTIMDATYGKWRISWMATAHTFTEG